MELSYTMIMKVWECSCISGSMTNQGSDCLLHLLAKLLDMSELNFHSIFSFVRSYVSRVSSKGQSFCRLTDLFIFLIDKHIAYTVSNVAVSLNSFKVEYIYFRLPHIQCEYDYAIMIVPLRDKTTVLCPIGALDQHLRQRSMIRMKLSTKHYFKDLVSNFTQPAGMHNMYNHCVSPSVRPIRIANIPSGTGY